VGKKAKAASRKGGEASRAPSSTARGKRQGAPASKAQLPLGRQTGRGRPDGVMVCLHLIVLLVPLAMSNLSWLGIGSLTADEFDLVKVGILRALVLVGMGIWGWRFLTRGGALRRSKVDYLILGFLGWTLLTSLLSIDRATAVFGRYQRYEGLLTFLTYGAVFFLVLQTVDSAGKLRSLARTLVLGGVLVSLYALLQYMGLDPIAWQGNTFEAHRAFSTFGNPDFLGGYLLFPLVLLPALALSAESTRSRAAYWLGFLLVMGAWAVSFTRGAWVGGVLGLLLLGFAAWRARVRLGRVDLSFLATALLAGVVIVLRSLSSADQVTNVAKRLRSIFAFSQGSGETRLQIWQAAASAIRRRPLQGYGADTFRIVYPRFKPAAIVRTTGYQWTADNAHNYPLQLASGLGIPGALLFYGLVGWVLALAWPAAFSQGTPRERLVLAGLWGAAAAYVIHLMFGISVTGSTVLLWFGLAALVVPTSWARQVAAPRWGKGLAVGLLLLVATCFAGNLVYVAADHYAAKAMTASTVDGQVHNYRLALELNPFNEQYRLGLGLTYAEATSKWLARGASDRAAGNDPGPSLAAARASWQEGVDTLEAARRRSPYEIDAYLQLSNLDNIGGKLDPANYRRALRVAQQGLALAPLTPGLLFQAAASDYWLGDSNGALQQAEGAVGLDPAYPEPLMLIGDVYMKRHDLARAKTAYEGALRLKPDSQAVRKALGRVNAALSTSR
jgi:O-antigen ligase